MWVSWLPLCIWWPYLPLRHREAWGKAVCVCRVRARQAASVHVLTNQQVSRGPAGDASTLSGGDSRCCHLYKRHESTPGRTGRPTKKQPIIQSPDWHRVDRAERERERWRHMNTLQGRINSREWGHEWQRAFWAAAPIGCLQRANINPLQTSDGSKRMREKVLHKLT